MRGTTVKALIVGLLLAVGVSTFSGCGESSRKPSRTSSAPNLEAANGPLVGEPTLIPEEQTCETEHPNEPWFATIAAFEVYDSARTHLYACAHFLGSTTSPNEALAYKSPDVYQTPYNIVTRGPGNLYI